MSEYRRGPEQPAGPSDVDAIKAALRRQFPSWSIIHSDQGRWWATRMPVVNPWTGVVTGYRCADLDADTAGGLAEMLRFVEVTEPTHSPAALVVEPKTGPSGR